MPAPPPPLPRPVGPARDRRAVACALAVVGLALLGASAMGLATSTETRYAEIGREMRASGDWVVPRLNGAPHLEKPPWTYAALALAYAVAGANDVAARLPGLLAGALTLLVVAGVVRRHAPSGDGDPAGRGASAALVLGTMPAFLAQAFTVSTDAWLVLASTGAGAAVLASLAADGRPPRRWTLALHAALGVGILAKGPAVLVTPLAGAVAAAVARRDVRVLRPFVDPLGLLLLLALVVPWFLLANARIPGLLDLYLARRLVGGVASAAEFHAEHGPHVVWVPVLLGTAPWIGGVIGAVPRLWSDGGRRGLLVPLAAMALATPLLFTFSASRLISYASPAIPWVAALVAAGAPPPGVADGVPTRRFRWHLALATVATALAVVALAVVPWLVPGAERTTWTTAATIAAAVVAVAALGIRRAPAPTLVAVALVVGLAATATAYRERLGAHRPIVEALASRRAAGEAVGVAIHKDGDWGLVPFYLGETVRFFGYEARLSTRPPEADAPEGFRPIEEVRAWWDVPERRWLLVRAKVTNPHNDVRRRLEGTRVVEVARYGRYALITNRE